MQLFGHYLVDCFREMMYFFSKVFFGILAKISKTSATIWCLDLSQYIMMTGANSLKMPSPTDILARQIMKMLDEAQGEVVSIVIGKGKGDVLGITEMVNGTKEQEIKRKQGRFHPLEHMEQCHEINTTLRNSQAYRPATATHWVNCVCFLAYQLYLKRTFKLNSLFLQFIILPRVMQCFSNSP
jgi:hypothetical protein